MKRGQGKARVDRVKGMVEGKKGRRDEWEGGGVVVGREDKGNGKGEGEEGGREGEIITLSLFEEQDEQDIYFILYLSII